MFTKLSKQLAHATRRIVLPVTQWNFRRLLGIFALVCCASLCIGFEGCSNSGYNAPPPPPVIGVSVAPGSQSVLVGTTKNFTAAVTNDSQSKGVTWTLSGSGCSGTACGTLSNVTTTSVTYTAPPNPATVTLTATSVSDNTKSGAATITVTSSNLNPVSVTTWRNDNSRSGVNAQESVLTLANVTTKF